MAKPTMAQKIVTWAQGKLGKKVGRGECWDLAEQALEQAGAMTSTDLGPVEEDSDYIWGDELNDVKDVQTGDVLQLRDHVTTTTTEWEYTYPDGTVETANQDETLERPHHTSIVTALPDANGVVRTLEQNVQPGGKVVQTKTLVTRDIPTVVTKSTARRKNPTTEKVETAKVKKTVTVTTTGTIWAYRPKPK